MFAVELRDVTMSLIALVSGKDAEVFLGVTVSAFLEDQHLRETVVKKLQARPTVEVRLKSYLVFAESKAVTSDVTHGHMGKRFHRQRREKVSKETPKPGERFYNHTDGLAQKRFAIFNTVLPAVNVSPRNTVTSTSSTANTTDH